MNRAKRRARRATTPRPARQPSDDDAERRRPRPARHQPRQAALARRRPAPRALTKRDLLRYLARVAPWMLPHLADRPLFVTRFPNGVTRQELLPEALGAGAAVRPHGAHLLRSQRARRRLPHLREPRHAPLARPDGRARAARLVLPDRAARRTRWAAAGTFTGSEAALERSILNYPDFIVFDLDPYVYSGREAEGEEPELHRRAFPRTRRSRAPDA